MKLQPVSQDIWALKYQLKGVDQCVEDTFKRVAKALAACEKDHVWDKRFLSALRQGAIPAGRIMANVGAGDLKTNTSTINCTVSTHIEDSIEGIMRALEEAGRTLSSGAGGGYCFSTLRPCGAFISGLGASTSGPLSFMDIFDAMCSTISSAGGRRGAQMATFSVCHPDIEAFIRAKRQAGKFRHFNLSVLIPDAFIDAVNREEGWKLYFPLNPKDTSAEEVIYKPWPIHEGYILKDGLVACKVYNEVKAKDLWDLIMKSNYDFAEPGVLFIDRINAENTLSAYEDIIATNPCSEQSLPQYGACLLGSINLTKFVDQPFSPESSFAIYRFAQCVSVFTRMLDNVVELNGLPVERQRQEIFEKRRHGMGFFGLGSVFEMLGIRYGSPESIELTDRICRTLVLEGWKTGVELAKEKGTAPIFKSPGFSFESRYMDKIRRADPVLWGEIMSIGSRFTHHSSIAPTGTIALSFGNNCSNGIEPSFSHHYKRNIIKEGRKTKEQVDVYSYEYLLSKDMGLNAVGVSASELTPKEHIDVQAAAQYWVDSAISKTNNVDTDISFEAFKDIYLYAYDQGLKGCTTFRYNPEAFAGVLVNEKDLEATTYRFTLEDGATVEVRGNEAIEYDGETHIASNLFDAIKEGTYG